MKKIAINGLGRIGRLFFREVFDKGEFEIAAINDIGSPENFAYLLRYDTVYGKYGRNVSADVSGYGSALVVDGKRIPFLSEKDPAKLPWAKLDIDAVLESTGAFESFEKAGAHCEAGAKRVVISAPAKDADGSGQYGGGKTIIVGINEDALAGIRVSSNGSCTTNAVAPVVKIIEESIGIEKAILNTVHAYTPTQAIVDSPVKGNDFRRGRAGAQNIVPSTTGAALAVSRVIKETKDKFDGIALRVPVPTGSVADITLISKRDTTVEEIKTIFKKAAAEKKWSGIVKVTEDQIVSSDVIGEPYGAVIDLSLIKVVGGNLVKILSWYDNEMGYVATLLRHIKAAVQSLK